MFSPIITSLIIMNIHENDTLEKNNMNICQQIRLEQEQSPVFHFI